VRVAVAQIAPVLGDVEANLQRHREMAARARDEGADLLLFPELSLTGYRLEDAVPDVALAAGDERMAELAALSADDLSVVVGLVEEAGGHAFFNAALWCEQGRVLHTHRKSYLPTYGMFEEQRYFARGKRLQAFDTAHGRAGILICEDALHPSALTVVALDGAETIFVPSASPIRGVTATGEADVNARHWEGYLRELARAFGVFIVYANRVGVEDGQTFWGGSEIIGPDGGVLAKAAYHEEDFICALLPAGAVRRRRLQAPLLRDEDLDLTINELERIRGRVARRDEVRGADERRSEADVGRARQRGFDPGRDRGREDGRERRGRGYDREFERSDRFRRPDERERGRHGGREREYERVERRGHDTRREFDEKQDRRRPRFVPGGADTRFQRRGPLGRERPEERGKRRFDRKERDVRRFDSDAGPPRSRSRPERGERRARPVGGQRRRPVKREEDDDE
jgi:predicted amidohydrolase